MSEHFYTTTVRIDHPRRAMPTIRVFHDFVLLFEQDVYREDAPTIRDHLLAHLDDIEFAAYPLATVRRLVSEAVLHDCQNSDNC